MLTSIHQARPFNTRYVVAAAAAAHGDHQRTTHRTAVCNYWYINRMDSHDAFGATPNFSPVPISSIAAWWAVARAGSRH